MRVSDVLLTVTVVEEKCKRAYCAVYVLRPFERKTNIGAVAVKHQYVLVVAIE